MHHNAFLDFPQTCGHWLTKKPFRHESLLLDCKDQRLTKAEKRAAEKNYERDKLAASTYNYRCPCLSKSRCFLHSADWPCQTIRSDKCFWLR